MTIVPKLNCRDQPPTFSMECLVRRQLEFLGEDPLREGLVDTPRRAAEAMKFLTSGYKRTAAEAVGRALFTAEGSGNIIVRDIEFFSLCEHHMLPFYGKAHIGYQPRRKIIGLSKLPRLVEMFSRRFQVQEPLTAQIADALVDLLEARGVVVTIEARHLCMMMRGVQSQHAVTVTRESRGDDLECLKELFVEFSRASH